jgi:NADH-quinone oxidoreductase subunit J
MTLSVVLFLVVAVIAVATALGMLFSRNAVYAALYLILNFAAVAVLYLLLNAPFIAVAQITVYAGAIMVLFLFVIMLLGAEQTGRKYLDRPWWVQPVPLFLGAVLLFETIYILVAQLNGTLAGWTENLPAEFGSPADVGMLLFSKYLLPFEATSILLLIAIVGAIVLTRANAKKGENQ